MSDRIFLDANVLFSAAYMPAGSLRRLWALPAVVRVSSMYAANEAIRNLGAEPPARLARLMELLEGMELLTENPTDITLPALITLPAKDKPILLAAIGAQCTHLLTGDRRHFGALFGQRLSGVLVVTPAEYLNQRSSDK